MDTVGDLIDFDIIETQKENIQSLAGGRSAKTLAQIFSPVSVLSPPSHTRDLNDAIRAEYEKEILTIDESDDPLDIYDRYVRWTLNAYPSAQATPASQLLPLLERATRIFLKSEHYKNDPRYLKIWLNYIRFFSESPRETFVYLARHGVGDGLALYYEEFAAWLESAGRWNQAEEIYRMGVEKGARPTERLVRKFTNFQRRAQDRESGDQEHSSPALPTVRPALAAKNDPFTTSTPANIEPQVNSRTASSAPSRRQKMQIFSDDGVDAKPVVGDVSKGWENIGGLAERKKENTIAARPWAGEKLNVGSRQNLGVPKMPIFKDMSLPQSTNPQSFPHSPEVLSNMNEFVRDQQVVNERTGKLERVFVNLEAVYPNPNDPQEEYCFEELRASARGWLCKNWTAEKTPHFQISQRPKLLSSDTTAILIPIECPNNNEKSVAQSLDNLILGDENAPLSNVQKEEAEAARRMRREERANRTRKIKVREVKGETQTIRTNLSSPRGPKMKRKKSAEATMTVHTKAASDEIYELFNQPFKIVTQAVEDLESEEESDDDDDYTSGGESTGTGHMSGTTSDFEDETQGELTEVKSVQGEDDDTRYNSTRTEVSGTENDIVESEPEAWRNEERTQSVDSQLADGVEQVIDNDEHTEKDAVTPSSPVALPAELEIVRLPLALEGFDIPKRPYRNAAQTAQNRLPFMTPIVEKTESSLGTATTRHEKDYFNSKTPCPKTSRKTPTIPEMEDELWSSPFQEELNEVLAEDLRMPQPILMKFKSNIPSAQGDKPVSKVSKETLSKGPIIKEAQCNPMEDSVHQAILEATQPPISTFEGFFDHKNNTFGRKSEIRKFCRTIATVKGSRNGTDKTASTIMLPPILNFQGAEGQYAIKRELGAGAYAPVYLAERLDSTREIDDNELETLAVMGKGKFGVARQTLEAVKMEEPPSAWEFYIIRTAHRRLGVSRAADSIVKAYEMHIFMDEGYLIEEYRDQGTLLDLVNSIVQQNNNGAAMEELMAIYFIVELLRTVEALHAKGIIHGDLKADNVLVRMPPVEDDISPQYQPDGTHGWASKGITLIDLGRGIDMRAFRPDVQFIADWQTSATDCAEMRELRPWTFQADYHGIAAIAHTMLFGRYIETIVEKGAGAGVAGGKTYKLKEGLKRYWQAEIWTELFALLLNPGRHVDVEEGQKMPCVRGMRSVREKMETWLVTNGEKGVGLKALIRKAELLCVSRKK